MRKRLLNVLIEVGESEDYSEFVEIQIPREESEKIIKLLTKELKKK